MLDVQGPMVIVPAGREGDLHPKPVPDLLVGLLCFSEPKVQAVLDARANHVGEHLLSLVDLRAGDLHALPMEQRAEVAPQILSFVESEGPTLLETGKDDLETLLDTSRKQLSGLQRLGKKRFAHQSLTLQPARASANAGSSRPRHCEGEPGSGPTRILPASRAHDRQVQQTCGNQAR